MTLAKENPRIHRTALDTAKENHGRSTIPVLQKKTIAGTHRRNITLDNIQIKLKYDVQGNLESGEYEVQTHREDNLPAHIRGRAIYHMWKFAPGNSYKVPFEGQSQECEFINRHWYWIEWDNKTSVKKNLSYSYLFPSYPQNKRNKM